MTTSLRDRKKQAKRRAIVTSAMRLFAEHGYDQVRAEAIAAAAGVSRRTFFRYFPQKDGVVFPRHAEFLDAFDAALAGSHEWGFERLADALGRMVPVWAAHRDELVAQHRVLVTSAALIARQIELDVDWERRMVHAMETDGLAPGHARIAAAAVMGTLRATLRRWYGGGGVEDLALLGREALELLANGLGSRRG